MTEEKIFLEFDKNDFIVRLTPFLTKKGKWTGELYMGTVTTEDNDLDDEDYAALMEVTSLVSASVPLMEADLEFRNTLYKYAEDVLSSDEYQEPLHEYDEEEDDLIEGEENIIRVDFKK